MKASILKVCNNFVSQVLEKEKWFEKMVAAGDCDLILLCGTAVKKTKDVFSDIDIFLICKRNKQIKYHLKPVRLYNFKGEIFEISVLSTEKIYNDIYNKEDIHWWRGAQVIRNYNNDVKKALIKASLLTKREITDRLWTNFVNFEINFSDIKKQIRRAEFLSVKLLFNENIKLFIDSRLTDNGEFPSCKQLGNTLKKIDKKSYDKILCAQKINNSQEIIKFNNALRQYLVVILKKYGFSVKEISNWETYNLDKITFQYR